MTIQQLVSALFNLGAQTNAWNSTSAARDFWAVFAGLVAVLIAVMAVRTGRTPKYPSLHHR